jgi:predicted ATPase
MITKIEALNFGCFRHVSVSLGAFQALTGPNASGKKTFLDIVGLLRDIVAQGLQTAVAERSAQPENILFQNRGSVVELALETRIPEALRRASAKPELDTARYEAALALDRVRSRFEFRSEKFLLKKSADPAPPQPDLFPAAVPATLMTPGHRRDTKTIVSKVPGGNDNYYSETYGRAGKGWAPSYRLGPARSALRHLPADESALPVANWFRAFLHRGLIPFAPDPAVMRRPRDLSAATAETLLPDAANLAPVADRLRRTRAERYRDWIEHLRSAAPEISHISAVAGTYAPLFECADGRLWPATRVSDGRLRLAALCLPAFLDDFDGPCHIPYAETGLDSSAVVAVRRALTALPATQMFLTTRSAEILAGLPKTALLRFAPSKNGSTVNL